MGLFRKKQPDPQLVLHISSLLEKSNELADIINTTTDEKTFFTSYEMLITIFTELTEYNNIDIFASPPKKDLDNFIRNKDVALKAFYNRKRILQEKLLNIIDNSGLDSIDPYFYNVGKNSILKGKASIGEIQRYCKIGFNRASRIMFQLESFRVVGPEVETKPRVVLMADSVFDELYNLLQETNIRIDAINNNTTSVNSTINTVSNLKAKYDEMSGEQFEVFCTWLLAEHHFINIEKTKASGDHGIDILAEKDDITYAIQCKCYSSNIGNAAIQQAHTGRSLYHKDIAVVLTNQYFTQQAREEAVALGVKLWDRDKLNDMIEKSSLNTH